MIIFNYIKERIASFDHKELFKICLIYALICTTSVVGLMVYHVYALKDVQAKIELLNRSRSAVQKILTEYQIVQQQKNKIDTALQQNKTFNIQKYFQDLIQKNNLTVQSSSKFNRQKLPNGYIEESLQVTLNGISTQILCEILLNIEQETVLYIIGVDIAKVGIAKTINATITFATLSTEA